MPHMTELNREFASQGVQIIGVSLDSDRGSLSKFVRKHKLTWPQYYDGRGWKNKLAKAWGVNSIPRIFLLSPDGEVLWSGHPNGLDKQLKQAMQSHPPRLDEIASGSSSQSASANQARDDAVNAIQQARTAIDDGDLAQMLSLVAQVPDEVLTDRRVLGNARVLLAKLKLADDQADALTSAKEANPDAAARLDAITQAIRNQTASADTDSPEPKVHPKLIAAKFAQARKAHDAEDYPRAYRLYNWLLDRASETDEGHTAAQRIAEGRDGDRAENEPQPEECAEAAHRLIALAIYVAHHGRHHAVDQRRSEERRVGKECRSRWSPYH